MGASSISKYVQTQMFQPWGFLNSIHHSLFLIAMFLSNKAL
jgi:hypothetical protein